MEKARAIRQGSGDGIAGMKRRAMTALQDRCRTAVWANLDRIKQGCLEVRLPTGESRVFGVRTSAAKALLQIVEPEAIVRLALCGDVGLGDGYVAREWTTDNLSGVLDILARNGIHTTPRPGRVRLANIIERLSRPAAKGVLQTQPGSSFFQFFLDPAMNQTCGYYGTPDDTLERAQYNNARILVEKACLSASDHLLEIGCGWGGFAVESTRLTGCRVTAVTASEAEYDHVFRRVRALRLEDRVTVLMKDYRTVKGPFDKIICIEKPGDGASDKPGDFFSCCDRLLKPDGLMVLQVTTRQTPAGRPWQNGPDWAECRMQPASRIPSLACICEQMNRHSSFVIEDMENIGNHYALTLHAWRMRLEQAVERMEAAGYAGVLARKWQYAFAFRQACFASRTLSNFQLILTRPRNLSLPVFP